MAEPTVSELVRQVTALVKQVDDLVQQLRSDYVRKEVFEAKRLSDIRRLEALEVKETVRDKNASDTRRQLMVGLAIVALPAIFGFVLAVNNYLAAGGAK